MHNIVQAVRMAWCSACSLKALNRSQTSAQISLVVTWLCLLVGESLFNVASTTGAITPMRQVKTQCECPCVAS